MGMWTKDDFTKMIEYCRTVDRDFIAHLENDYENLSPRNMALAIMRHHGKTDDEMMRMFCVGASALRTMKTRINKKEKGYL